MTRTVNHSNPPQPVQALLDEAVWIRTLARRLARDASEADDLVQETLASALENPPDRGQPRRAWLAVVVANAARALRRSGSRREERERLAARPEAQPSTDELVERASVQRELVEAVLALDDPYREVVLLRFYEGLPPRAIAKRLAIPVDTVRTRIARAVVRLRARLDQRHGGDRTAWLALVLPPPEAAALSIPVAGGIVLNAKLAVLSVVAVLTVAALVLLRSPDPVAPRSSIVSAEDRVVVGPPIDRAAPELESALGASPRSAAARAVDPAPVTPTATAASVLAPRLRGVVLDAEGGPLAGVPLGWARRDVPVLPLGRSARDGRFDLDFPTETGALVADGDAWCTVLSASPSPAPDAPDAVLVVAPSLRLSGFVVDGAGTAIDGAELRFEMPDDLRSRFSVNLDRSVRVESRCTSSGGGRFAFGTFARVRGAALVASAPGFDSAHMMLETLVDPLTVVLTRPGEHAEVLQGIVVDASGVPVEDAWVALGIDTARTEANGRFVFRLDDPDSMNAQMGVPSNSLRALKPGFLPAEFEAPLVAGMAQWPASVTMRLGLETLSISGRVRDAEGEPRAGLRVWIADSEMFGAGPQGPLVLENVLAGIDDRVWSFAETDADGRFAIRGLLAREYVLRAQDPKTLLMVEEKGVEAGRTGVELRLPADGLFLRVAGVVRAHDGAPIAGVGVHPMCDSYRARYRGRVVGTTHDRLDGVVTDAEGRFILESVPRSLVYLRLDGAGILPLEYGRYVEGHPAYASTAVKELPRDRIESLDIRVDRRAHVQIQLADAAQGDAFRLLDATGSPIELSVFEGDDRYEGMQVEMREGRSPVVAGSDRGRTLLLLKDGAEVARRPVTLKPGETTIVAW